MGNFTKTDLIASVGAATCLPKGVVEQVLNALIDTIRFQTSAGDAVSLRGFGTFEQRKRSARNGRNPRTGETISIPASSHLAFRPSKS